MKALITGATGFIGSYLTKYLSDKGYKVYCLVRRTSKLDRLKKLNIKPNLIYGDITDLNSLKKAVKEKDYIFHLAAVINAKSWDEYYKVNYEGTRNIGKAIQNYNPNIKRLVYVSSIAASGPSKKGYLKKEDDKNLPINNYGKTKLMAEKAIKEELNDIPYTIIRPTNVIGPGQRELIKSINTIESGIMPLLGNGDPQTNIIYLTDLVVAITLAAESNIAIGKTYFITDGKVYSWRDIARIIQKKLGKRSVLPINYPALIVISTIISFLSKILGKTTSFSLNRIVKIRKSYWTYDGSKAEKELGFKTKVKIDNGIKEAIIDYLKGKY